MKNKNVPKANKILREIL